MARRTRGNGRDTKVADADRVERDVYPRPDYRFPNARIGRTWKESRPDFPPQERAPRGAPNVLLVLLDDVGYGWLETFGGLIESPTLERLAKTGLRYCQFHTTSLCSPTRAALLTGRNHHTVSTGTIQETATGYPGYTGIIPKSCFTIAEILKQNGFATGWWGKNHNVPDNQTSAAGPYDRWPTRMGFDYFYGFIAGETDQFHPALYRGTTPVDPPRTPAQGYQLTSDLADDCISWIRQQKCISPERPVFAYFAPGAAHAPHQPPMDRRGRHAGRFDFGWDEYRRVVHRRQLDAGVIAPGTRLTPRPKEIPGWDEFGPDEQRLFRRFAENYADFLEHADIEVGRVVQALDDLGQLDDTLVIYVSGDNGSSAEGTLSGTINELHSLNGYAPELSQVLPRIDEIGLPGTSPHYPVGWAWAGDTPFQWTKQIASHLGGTRNGMVVSWPARIRDVGATRFQFHHVIDVLPTILEACGIAEPTMVNGVAQRPVEGVSMAYTFDRSGADSPSRRRMQYFEMLGHRALYSDGWIACCRHGRVPWQNAGSVPFEDDQWELYRIDDDFSQAEDLAATHPAKLRELQDLFWSEAGKYGVLPLDDRLAERLDVTLRPGWFTGRHRVTLYPGMVRLPEGSAPKLNNVDHAISANLRIPDDGAEGVIVCLGGDAGGWTLFMRDGRLVYHYNWFDLERYEFASTETLPNGRVEVKLEFACETDVPGGPANVRLFVDGRACGGGRIDKQVRSRFSVESLDVGVDKMSPVTRTYPKGAPGCPFTGRIEHVTFEFERLPAERPLAQRLDEHLAID